MSELREYQRAFLLLQLLAEKDRRMKKGEANKAVTTGPNKTALGLTTRDANALRDEMAPDLINVAKEGRATVFELTEEGLRHLTTLPQYPARLAINGRAISRLIAAVHQGRQPAPAPAPASQPASEPLPEFILRSVIAMASRPGTELVPIHEVRSAVEDELGRSQAAPEVFDAALKELRRSGALKLVPISDLRKATQDELAASLPGVHETLFYVEVAG